MWVVYNLPRTGSTQHGSIAVVIAFTEMTDKKEKKKRMNDADGSDIAYKIDANDMEAIAMPVIHSM